jgi:hypothetical protein
MANPENQTETAPWTIKAVGVRTRKIATDCAAREGITMGQWMDRMVPLMATIQEGNQVLPPDQRGIAPPSEHQQAMMDIERMDALARLTAAVASAAAAGVPKRAVGEVAAALREQTRLARGLPALVPSGKPPGKRLANRADPPLIEG